MAKKWLFWFCEGSVCVSGQNQMCRLCGCLKLFLKNAGRQKKIKKHWGGLSVGLLAVPFQYGLYVFGHLSKWFVFVLMFKFWSVYRLWNGRPTIGYNLHIPAINLTQAYRFGCIIAVLLRMYEYTVFLGFGFLLFYTAGFTQAQHCVFL